MTPALISAPFVHSAWPCGLNTARFAAAPDSKRNSCEHWQGVKLIGVLDLIVRQIEKSKNEWLLSGVLRPHKCYLLVA